MITSRLLVSGIVSNVTEAEDDISRIQTFLIEHALAWKTRPVLWDLRRFDFVSLSSANVRQYVDTITGKARPDGRTALLVDPDLGLQDLILTIRNISGVQIVIEQ